MDKPWRFFYILVVNFDVMDSSFLEDHLLPCFWKKHFGITCFGCGIQRAVLLIFQGKFVEAFQMYPAVYTLGAMLLFLVAHSIFKFKYGAKILIALFVLNIAIILINYFLKYNC